MKLDEFRLESYNERSLLQLALLHMKHQWPDDYPKEREALMLRLSHTQCQPGGCSLCGGPPEDWE